MSAAGILAEYQASRAPGTDRSVLCHAPFVNLNFDQSGQVTACCYNRQKVLGRYPAQSVREIWSGRAAEAMRGTLRGGSLAGGCERCLDQFRSRNFSGALMRGFDRYSTGRGAGAAKDSEFPLVLEFEISNLCNLECVMCGGHWSSAIRARRERLPPIRNPYDRRFVEQIEEFLPTIVAAKFLGGEPLLIPLYLEIWESLRRLNPEAEVSITTSGAILPERPRRMLEHLRANIVVSLDGVTSDTYEAIRRNARLERVMESIRYFRDYTLRRGTTLAAAVCPMTHNWSELPAIVDFCEEMRMPVFFNTVTLPIESSLAGLDPAALAEVVDVLEAGGRAAGRSWTSGSRAQWQALVDQLRTWLEDKREAARRRAEAADTARERAAAEAAEAAQIRGRLTGAWALLDFDAADRSKRARIEGYFEALVASRAGTDPPEISTEAAAVVDARIRNLADLHAALHAVHLLQICSRPLAEHDGLRRRLERVRAALTPELTGQILWALRKSDIRQVHAFLSKASDEEIERALRTVF